jgi:hypothetical protein
MKTMMFQIFLALFSIQSFAAETPNYYARFRDMAQEHKSEVQRNGLSYMIGGGIGFGASLAMGITSEEVVPKIGYSLIQTLSAASFYYGAVSYYEGDRLVQEADRLADLDAVLGQDKEIREKNRREALNRLTVQILQEERARLERLRKIRGYVALSTAVSSGLTIALSKSSGTASNLSLGFIMLISTVGAASDLFFSTKPTKMKELFVFEPIIGPGYFQGTVGYKW